MADRQTGFWKSTDEGATWTQINNGIFVEPENGFTQGYTINVNPNNGNLLAGINGCLVSGTSACNNGTNTPARLYESTDEGSTWTQIVTHFTAVPAPAYSGPAFVANGGIVWGAFWTGAASCATFWSNDELASTTDAICVPQNQGDAYSYAYNPRTGEVFEGTEASGYYRSTDGGHTFIQVAQPRILLTCRMGNAYATVFDENNYPIVSSAGGIWKASAPGGTSCPSTSTYTWTNVLPNSNTAAGKALYKDPFGYIYYGHNGDVKMPQSVLRSTDDGNTWLPFDMGVANGLVATTFVYNPRDSRLYAIIAAEDTDMGKLYRTAP